MKQLKLCHTYKAYTQFNKRPRYRDWYVFTRAILNIKLESAIQIRSSFDVSLHDTNDIFRGETLVF